MPTRPWEARGLKRHLANPSLVDPEVYLSYRREDAPSFISSSEARKAYGQAFATIDNRSSEGIDAANRVVDGQLRYFTNEWIRVGDKPDWFTNHLTGAYVAADRHWSGIDEFSAGDIKMIWEPSRFSFAYLLVRAYWRSGDERFAERFWRLVESWRMANSPNTGPNWKCGQEVSLRGMAWCFGLYGFMGARASTPERVMALAEMLAASGERIAGHIEYALSQKNNHGIAEAAGLWTIGALFPELKRASEWRGLGQRQLEKQARELIAEDGSFSQHSVHYHRFILQVFLWVLALAERQGVEFSAELRARVGRAVDWLEALIDDKSGRMPCYGANDGSLVLPLTSCDYTDFRPVVQAAYYWVHRQRRFPPGPYDEELLWLFGPEASRAPIQTREWRDVALTHGGYYVLRGEQSHVFTRAGEFRHRPSHADLLHADLWWRGINVAIDSGTFSYNAPAPWNNELVRTAVHNTVGVDGRDQMERVSRFLFLPWAIGKGIGPARSREGTIAAWEGSHNGWARLQDPVAHRRALISLPGDFWLVVDQLNGRKLHDYRLHWLLCDAPHSWAPEHGHMKLQFPPGDFHLALGTWPKQGTPDLVRASPDSTRGWCSPYYMRRDPALSVAWNVNAFSARFWTLFGPGDGRVDCRDDHMTVSTGEWKAEVALRDEPAQGLIERIVVERGDETDEWHREWE